MGLSGGQRRFARDHGALAGPPAVSNEHMVFMYRRDLGGTRRWLVDEGGVIVECMWFPESREGEGEGREERSPASPGSREPIDRPI
jgi:hypothetical protein